MLVSLALVNIPVGKCEQADNLLRVSSLLEVLNRDSSSQQILRWLPVMLEKLGRCTI